MFNLRENCLETTTQFAAGEQHTPFALQAFQADIGSQAYDFPIVPTARMGFAQPYYIVQA
jgi:hypothetical protein